MAHAKEYLQVLQYRGGMDMRIVKISDKAAIVIPGEKIDISNSQVLKERLLELYDEGYVTITLDFSKVSAIDSSGLGKLLLFHKLLKERKGELCVTNVLSEHVYKMFKIIQLDKVIKIVS